MEGRDDATGLHVVFCLDANVPGRSEELSPVSSERHKRAIALHRTGDFTKALDLYNKELSRNPSGQLHYDRALTLWELGRGKEAIAGYDSAISLEPDLAAAHYNRATILQKLHHLPEALAGFDEALKLQGDLNLAWNNRAGVLKEMGRYQEALDSLDHVLVLRRDDRVLYNRGSMLFALERFEEAVADFEQALRINPKHPEALGMMASAALKSCDWGQVARLASRIRDELTAGVAVLPPLMLLNYCDDPLLQRKSSQINLALELDRAHITQPPAPLWQGQRYNHERIRIAYLSSDLREHPVGRNVVNVLEHHDRAHFEAIGIFTSRSDDSELFLRISNTFDQFHNVAALSDEEVAQLIRALEVDILVDLNGQTDGWRPGICRFRPAPIIATWLGYAGTTGADFIDYIIADAIVAPLKDQSFFSESISHLPSTFWPASTPPTLAEACRVECGLPSEGFVFACLNNPWKIGAAQFHVWMRLLKAVPGSVLWLRQGNGSTIHNLRMKANSLGVSAGRIIFAPPTETNAQHLTRLKLADLFLDTFPYNAHATAADALMVGLPIVTMKGASFASRVAASLLAAVGLSDLVTEDIHQYENLALALAKDPTRLKTVRERLGIARATAPLFNPVRFASDLEELYRNMLKNAYRKARDDRPN